jgi:hypothetical protein
MEFTFEIGTSPQTPSVETEPAGPAGADEDGALEPPAPAAPDDPPPGAPAEQALRAMTTTTRGSANARRERIMVFLSMR